MTLGLLALSLRHRELRQTKVDFGQLGRGQAPRHRQADIGGPCLHPVAPVPRHLRQVEGCFLVVGHKAEQNPANFLGLIKLPGAVHQHAHENAQNRLALIRSKLAQVPAQNGDDGVAHVRPPA